MYWTDGINAITLLSLSSPSSIHSFSFLPQLVHSFIHFVILGGKEPLVVEE